jgi:hypothetical protein
VRWPMVGANGDGRKGAEAAGDRTNVAQV